MRPQLGQRAAIVENSNFESGIVKVRRQKQAALNVAENSALRKLQVSASRCRGSRSYDNVCGVNEKFAMQELKRRRHERLVQTRSNYLDLRFILPTSNFCEHLFSLAGYAVSDRRMALLPSNC